ncbi:MAG: phosphatidylserine decarboxylase [Elusimicrobia bacterium]|nr:phosphatidylserine decarboxylase [Elusimicrobiota bacterium]
MGIAKPGLTYVSYGVAAVAVGWTIARFPAIYSLGIVLQFLGLLFALFSCYFFRDPERPLPADPMMIYSPGDGKVLSVEHEGKDGGLTLRIFLSVMDVHVQRSPCAGTVEWVRRHAGAFAPAMQPHARTNARVELCVRPEGRDPVVVEQIVGIIARRIECWAGQGEKLAAGQRYGIIHFGSQVAVRFPPSAKCTARVGERVVGGVSVVGEWTGKR